MKHFLRNTLKGYARITPVILGSLCFEISEVTAMHTPGDDGDRATSSPTRAIWTRGKGPMSGVGGEGGSSSAPDANPQTIQVLEGQGRQKQSSEEERKRREAHDAWVAQMVREHLMRQEWAIQLGLWTPSQGTPSSVDTPILVAQDPKEIQRNVAAAVHAAYEEAQTSQQTALTTLTARAKSLFDTLEGLEARITGWIQTVIQPTEAQTGELADMDRLVGESETVAQQQAQVHAKLKRIAAEKENTARRDEIVRNVVKRIQAQQAAAAKAEQERVEALEHEQAEQRRAKELKRKQEEDLLHQMAQRQNEAQRARMAEIPQKMLHELNQKWIQEEFERLNGSIRGKPYDERLRILEAEKKAAEEAYEQAQTAPAPVVRPDSEDDVLSAEAVKKAGVDAKKELLDIIEQGIKTLTQKIKDKEVKRQQEAAERQEQLKRQQEAAAQEAAQAAERQRLAVLEEKRQVRDAKIAERVQAEGAAVQARRREIRDEVLDRYIYKARPRWQSSSSADPELADITLDNIKALATELAFLTDERIEMHVKKMIPVKPPRRRIDIEAARQEVAALDADIQRYKHAIREKQVRKGEYEVEANRAHQKVLQAIREGSQVDREHHEWLRKNAWERFADYQRTIEALVNEQNPWVEQANALDAEIAAAEAYMALQGHRDALIDGITEELHARHQAALNALDDVDFWASWEISPNNPRVRGEVVTWVKPSPYHLSKLSTLDAQERAARAALDAVRQALAGFQGAPDSTEDIALRLNLSRHEIETASIEIERAKVMTQILSQYQDAFLQKLENLGPQSRQDPAIQGRIIDAEDRLDALAQIFEGDKTAAEQRQNTLRKEQELLETQKLFAEIREKGDIYTWLREKGKANIPGVEEYAVRVKSWMDQLGGTYVAEGQEMLDQFREWLPRWKKEAEARQKAEEETRQAELLKKQEEERQKQAEEAARAQLQAEDARRDRILSILQKSRPNTTLEQLRGLWANSSTRPDLEASYALAEYHANIEREEVARRVREAREVAQRSSYVAPRPNLVYRR